jgi:hypothetical protein
VESEQVISRHALMSMAAIWMPSKLCTSRVAAHGIAVYEVLPGSDHHGEDLLLTDQTRERRASPGFCFGFC